MDKVLFFFDFQYILSQKLLVEILPSSFLTRVSKLKSLKIMRCQLCNSQWKLAWIVLKCKKNWKWRCFCLSQSRYSPSTTSLCQTYLLSKISQCCCTSCFLISGSHYLEHLALICEESSSRFILVNPLNIDYQLKMNSLHKNHDKTDFNSLVFLWCINL